MPTEDVCWKQIWVAGLAAQHGGAVVSTGIGADKVVAVEHVEGFVVGVGPDAHLGIVVEVGVLERVAIPGAGGVGRDRDGDALHVGAGGDGELAHHPAVGELVVGDDGIAVVVELAAAAEAGPQRIGRDRAGDERAVGLVKDGEVGVDPLHILRCADRAVGVGRDVLDGEAVLAVADTFEAEADLRRVAAGGELADGIFGERLEPGRQRDAARGLGFQLAVGDGTGIAHHLD